MNNGEKSDELIIAYKELAFQNEEKEKRAAELVIANEELVYQNGEKEIKASQLVIANKELIFQNDEKEKRAAELVIANEELAFQNTEKEKRAAELVIANIELAFQNKEKEKRAAELMAANKELVFQNQEKEKRAQELTIANKELVFQNKEKGKRAEELIIANKELVFQNEEKEKRAAELIIANQELHEIENSEHELLEIKNRLELELEVGKQLQKQKDDFIGIASHELKTPLTSLKSSMQLLTRWILEDPSSSKIQHIINLSNGSINKLTNLLDELLNDTKIIEGQLQLKKSTFIIADMVNDCCGHVRASGAHELIAKGDLHLKIYADKQRIDQVMVNLVNNAVKYAPLSKVIVILIEQVNNMAKISVIDEGPGIPPEKLPYLFKRYYRVDDSGTSYSGLGLGLFISSEIVRRHGGEIIANSELGTGSTFWFTIPIEC